MCPTGIVFQGVNVSMIDGFDIAFTRLVLQDYLGAAVAYLPYPDTSSMYVGLRNGECDMAASAIELDAGRKRCGPDCPDTRSTPMTVLPAEDYSDYAYRGRQDHVCCLDYSLSYLPASGFALFSQAQAAQTSLVRAILSYEVLNAATPVFIALVSFGWVMVLVERKANPKQFKSQLAGVYFAFVSMATFGFGDLAPVTRTGRVLTILWTITSVLSLSAFTSVVSARLTVSQLGVATIDSLRQVGPSAVCVEAAYPLAQQLISEAFGLDGNIRAAGVMLSSVEGCAQAVMNGTAMVYVSDQPILRWLAYSFYGSSSLYVSPVIRGNPFSFAYPAGSPLRSVIDAALIQFTTNTTWVSAATSLQAIWFPVMQAQAPTSATSITKPTFIAAMVLLGVPIVVEVGRYVHRGLRSWRARAEGKLPSLAVMGEEDGHDVADGDDGGAAAALREAERAKQAVADAVAMVNLAAEAANAAAFAAAALAQGEGVHKRVPRAGQPAADGAPSSA